MVFSCYPYSTLIHIVGLSFIVYKAYIHSVKFGRFRTKLYV